MAELIFKQVATGQDVHQLDLPVEIRTRDFHLVRRVPASRATDVSPGEYLIVVTPPSGDPIYQLVEVAEGAKQVVTIQLPERALGRTGRAPRSLAPKSFSFSDAPTCQAIPNLARELSAGVGLERALAPRIKLYWQTGNWFESGFDTSPDPDPVRRFVEPFRETAGPPQGPTKFLQLSEKGRPVFTFALPADAHHPATIDFIVREDGVIGCEVTLENRQADLMMRYLRQGDLTQAGASLDSPLATLERLLLEKVQDPVGALVAAYVLLRMRQLDTLGKWTELLYQYQTWSTDALIVFAEHRARLGDHVKAFEVLVGLPDRGLPIFSDGLSHAVERLRLYDTPGVRSRLQTTPEKQSAAGAVLNDLQRLAVHVDFSEPLLTVRDTDLAQIRARP